MTEDTSATVPADDAPPADPAGAVGSDGGTGVAAGAVVEVVVDESEPHPDAVMLKIAPSAEGEPQIESLEMIGYQVTSDEAYQAFAPEQAAALLAAADEAGVTLLNQADEEGSGGTSAAQ